MSITCPDILDSQHWVDTILQLGTPNTYSGRKYVILVGSPFLPLDVVVHVILERLP